MAAEWDDTPYSDHIFLTVTEAQWAVFFDTQQCGWRYNPDGQLGTINADHYRPQFSLSEMYLEVQRPGDNQIRKPLLHHHPKIEENLVFLAIGDIPDPRSLSRIGWWDSDNKQGIQQLTPGFEWELWFPVDSDDVLMALETARDYNFWPQIPQQRPPGTATEIPERERESEEPTEE